MTLRIIDCKATPNSIKVFFSDAVNVVSDPKSASFDSSAANVKNYEVSGKNSSGAPIPIVLKPDITPIRGGHAIVLTPNNSLLSGSAIIVTAKNIKNVN